MTTTLHSRSAARGDTGGRPARGRRFRRDRLDQRASPYLYVLPFFVVFGVFGVFPLLYTGWISFTGWDPTKDGSQDQLVGLANYAELIHDSYFWNALEVTLVLGVLGTVPQLFAALGIAHLLNRRLRARTFWRTGVLAPYITSVASVGIVFQEVFARNYGMANWVLRSLHLTSRNIDFQADRGAAWIALALMVIWQWTGYNALLYLAGMQSIPHDLYESAELDGASGWRQFWSITVPMLRPTILFTVIVSTIGALQLFGQPFLFDLQADGGGGADRQFQTLSMYVYQTFYQHFRYGYAAAISWALFGVTIIAVLLNLIVTRRLRGND
jgi:cellobiose transport system permease protein